MLHLVEIIFHLDVESKHIKKYTDVVTKIFREKLAPPSARHVFLSSGDTRILQLTRSLLNTSYLIKTSPLSKTLELTNKRHNSAKYAMQQILMDIYFLVRCDWVIVTSGSEIGHLIWELRNSQFPYNGGNHVISVDHNKIFSSWYAYETLLTYFLTIRDNNKTMHYGEYQIIPYSKGQLYFKKGTITSSLKSFPVNGSIVIVRLVELHHSKNPIVRGYVFEKDLIVWPGRPLYKNDLFVG